MGGGGGGYKATGPAKKFLCPQPPRKGQEGHDM